ncbi:hypothetical protein ILYODFUR_017451 [Ilyodon furcidens]|uniref:Uncharacterized protein n=1 Tax=Ilyodon furcidens TaxID=33524 RepID=A0ABV0VET0_9TELE
MAPKELLQSSLHPPCLRMVVGGPGGTGCMAASLRSVRPGQLWLQWSSPLGTRSSAVQGRAVYSLVVLGVVRLTGAVKLLYQLNVYRTSQNVQNLHLISTINSCFFYWFQLRAV